MTIVFPCWSTDNSTLCVMHTVLTIVGNIKRSCWVDIEALWFSLNRIQKLTQRLVFTLRTLLSTEGAAGESKREDEASSSVDSHIDGEDGLVVSEGPVEPTQQTVWHHGPPQSSVIRKGWQVSLTGHSLEVCGSWLWKLGMDKHKPQSFHVISLPLPSKPEENS